MPRILAIDYGLKRTGIAVTDPLKIIATGLTTVPSKDLLIFLKKYFSEEDVELILVGEPRNLDDTATHATPLVEKLIATLKRNFPSIPIRTIDERFSSKIASKAIMEMGLKKKQRQNKALVDQVAATMLLQEFLRNL